MNVLIACDKFKYCASSVEINQFIAEYIKELMPDWNIRTRTIADGGEGSLDVLAQTKRLQKVKCTVADPLFRPIQSYFLLNEQTAYLEMSLASGLAFLHESEKNPMRSSSYGTGQLIRLAMQHGASEILLFVGGSATNDMGMGALVAMGCDFYDATGREVLPIGANLILVEQITHPHDWKTNGLTIRVLTDVQNHLFGPNGATHIYAAQKGASSQQIEILEKGVLHFTKKIAEQCKVDISSLAGSGAAGGIAAGLAGFFPTQIQSGIDWFIHHLGLQKEVDWADWVISGEGKLDHQSLKGKVIAGVHNACARSSTPLAIFCGQADVRIKDQLMQKHVYVDDVLSYRANIQDSIDQWQEGLSEVIQTFIRKQGHT